MDHLDLSVGAKNVGITLFAHAEFDFDTFSMRRHDCKPLMAKDHVFRALRPVGRSVGRTHISRMHSNGQPAVAIKADMFWSEIHEY